MVRLLYSPRGNRLDSWRSWQIKSHAPFVWNCRLLGANRPEGRPAHVNNAWNVQMCITLTTHSALIIPPLFSPASPPTYLDLDLHCALDQYVSLDILHTLHCMESLRQTLDPDYYPARRAKLHLYHCIDHIRQWIMCSGDFTPIPARWHPEKNSSYVDTDQVHTCRNCDAVANWVKKREKRRRDFYTSIMSILIIFVLSRASFDPTH